MGCIQVHCKKKGTESTPVTQKGFQGIFNQLPVEAQAIYASNLTQEKANLAGVGWLPQVQYLLNQSKQIYMNQNVKAMLDVIAWCEGTKDKGDDGYNILFGGGKFTSYKDHPRIAFKTKWGNTSAAGRYQFMARVPGKTILDTWGEVQRKLKLPDFSPASQDLAAIELIKQNGAYNDILAGRITKAIWRLRNIWASLPGSEHNQPTRPMSKVIAKYKEFGGIFVS